MNRWLLLFQFGSIVISLLVSRAIFTAIMSRLSRGNGCSPNFVSKPTGSSLLFGGTFVVVWFVLSFLAVLAWMLLRRAG